MTLKALIFDVDGTVAQTADVKRAAFNQVFDDFNLGWIWSRPLYQSLLNSAAPGQEIEVFGAEYRPLMFEALRDSGRLSEIKARHSDIYLALLEAGAAQMRPGVARLISDAKTAGLRVGLCSTGMRREYETILFNRFGLDMIDTLFATVACEDLSQVTPRAAYKLLLSRMGVSAEEAIAIDDSESGINAVACLGMAGVATPSYYTETQAFSAALLVLSDLGHPAAPFEVFKGQALGHRYASVEALRAWHQVAQAHVVEAA